MVQFAHISDTHLGYRQFNNESRENDFYEAFNEAIDKIIEEHVDFVIHSGDLFESNRPYPRALKVAQEAIMRLRDANIKFYAIPGNHDLVYRKGAMPPQTVFTIFDNFVLLGRKIKYAMHDDVFIGGVIYHPKFYVNALKEDLKIISTEAKSHSKRILIIHQALDRYLPFPGAFELRLEELPTIFNYYAFGHIHQRILESYGDGIIAYAGSTDIWRMDEIPDYKEKKKGFYLVDFSKGEPEVQSINLESTRPFDSFSIETEDFDRKFKEIVSKVKALSNSNSKKPVIRVTLVGNSIKEFPYYNSLISKELRKITLLTRVDFKVLAKEIAIEGYELMKIDLKRLFNEHFKDENIAEFAYELFKKLAHENIDGAKKFAEYFFEQRWKP